MRRFLVMLFLLIAVPVAAQDADSVSLFADEIRYETGTRRVIARGNVEVYYGTARLSATQINYDAEAGIVTAEGPLKLETPQGAIILASLAELSTDFREGLIEGARLILDQQFQIASVEAKRSDGRLNTLYKTVASTCSVCAERPIPLWRIRARKIVHDEQKERLYFEGAWFDILGIPVAYLPRLRIPEPGVDRAAGILVPTFSSSDIYGFGVKVPYYVPIGNHADATLTPFLTTNGTVILEAEYRQQTRAGAFRLEGALALKDQLRDGDARGYFNADALFMLDRGYRAEFDINLASDKDFLRQYSYSDADRLNSQISVNRYRARDYLDFRIEGFQTLRESESQGEIPLVLPRVDYRRYWYDGPVPGKLGVSAGLLSLVRSDGRDVLRLNGGMDWRYDRTLRNGMQVAALADLGIDYYTVTDDPTFADDPYLRVTPTIGTVLRWPFVRHSSRATHVIEPVFQLLHTAGDDDDVPNEDSLLVELDETNLFTLNRYPGIDGREDGWRLNYGVTYTRYDPEGWNLGVTVGQVLKPDEDLDFALGTGLRTATSDFVAAVTFELPPELTLVGRTLFDTELDFKRVELGVSYDRPNLGVDAAYTLLSEDNTNPILGPVPRREELSLDARYQLTPNWRLEADYRYDLAASQSIDGSAGLIYRNDCAEIGLSVSRRFTTSNNVPPSTEYSLQVRLLGLGGSDGQDRPAPTCAGL